MSCAHNANGKIQTLPMRANREAPALIRASAPASLRSEAARKRFELFIFRTAEKLEQALLTKMRAKRSK